MECAMLFDVGKEGFHYWYIMILGIIFALILYPISTVFRWVFGGFRLGLLILGPFYYRGTTALIALLFGCLSVFIVVRSYIHYRELVTAIDNGTAQTVQGRVADFEPAPRLGSRLEKFSVDGKRFSYSAGEIGPGFHQTRDQGNPLRNGDFVKITYVGDVITRIEICDRQDEP
jgi:hypothetical protein